MIKKVLYAGVLLVALSAAVFLYIASAQYKLTAQLSSNVTASNFTVGPGNYSYVSTYLPSASYLLASVRLSGRANVYVLNSTAFGFWSNRPGPGASQSGLAYAASLEGKGAMIVYRNATVATVPYVSSVSVVQPPLYGGNQTAPYGQGTYYLVVDNTNGSASRPVAVAANVVYPQPITNSSLGVIARQEAGLAPYGILFFVLFVAGVAACVYGLFKAPKGENAPAQGQGKELKGKGGPSQEYIDELYKGVSKSRREKRRLPGQEG